MRFGLLALLLLAAAPAARGESLPARRSDVPVTFINGIADTGQFLPDSTVIATVGARKIYVGQYIDAYFASYPEFRPRPDSLGRVEFLNSMLDKDILGQTALAAGRPLDFTDRAKLREHTQRALANVVYQRLVVDSVKVSEQDLHDSYETFRFEKRFRRIVFHDLATAERVRRDLILGRLPWKQAVAMYSKAKGDKGPDGDVGWIPRMRMNVDLAMRIYGLKPGETSPVVQDRDGYQVVMVTEQRPADAPDFGGMRTLLKNQLIAFHSGERAERVQEQIRREIGLTYDTTNVVWACARFVETGTVSRDPLGTTLEMNVETPNFAPADTARVLARWRDGRFTLGDLMAGYLSITPLMRQSMNTPEAMRTQIDAFVLEPFMADLGRRLGFDKDPVAVRLIEQKREEILVEHLFGDSVQSKVSVTSAERKKFYADHLKEYVTYPMVRFALFVRPSRAAADSVTSALAAGARAADLVFADSLLGPGRSSLGEKRENEQSDYHKLLFEELRPGKSTTLGPDKAGQYLVLHLIEYRPGEQLPFEQVEQYADESLQNIKAEATLKALIARQKRRYPVIAHPELVMRIRLVDKTLD